MKATLIFSSILILTLLTSCGSPKKTPEKKIVTKENLLDGLQPVNGYTIPTNLLNQDVPIYNEDAKLITREEMEKMTSSGKYKSMPYVDEKNDVKLWLITLMTEADKKQLDEATQKRLN